MAILRQGRGLSENRLLGVSNEAHRRRQHAIWIPTPAGLVSVESGDQDTYTVEPGFLRGGRASDVFGQANSVNF